MNPIETDKSQTQSVDSQEETVEMEEKFYPLILSVDMYEFFMANGQLGREARELYMHLQYTARLQKSNQVWANNRYLATGLGMGQLKIKAAKAFLVKHGLIEYVQPRDENGRIGKSYIKLKYIHRKESVIDALNNTGGITPIPAVWQPLPAGIETAGADIRTTGGKQQMLKVKKGNASSKKQREGITSLSSEKKREYAPNVFLTEQEYDKLCERFGVSIVDSKIEDLSCYLGNNVPVDKYKDHYLTLTNWLKKDATEEEFQGVMPKPKCPDCGGMVLGGVCMKCGWSKSRPELHDPK